jgi:regulator of sigma E protease
MVVLFYLAPILVFGLVVFVHELGHFLAAKATGVYAPRFSIGFGPALFRKRWGETEYVIAALPLGGYVRMASREDETMAMIEGGGERARLAPKHEGAHPGVLAEVAGEVTGESRPAGWDPNAMLPFGPQPVPEHRWFESKSLAARLFIMLAGVTMNALLAAVVAIFMIAHYGRTVVGTRVVGGLSEEAAQVIGGRLVAGDTLLRVGSRRIQSWDDVVRALGTERSPVAVVSQRDSFTLDLGDGVTERRQAVVDGLEFYIPPVVDSVIATMPAAKAGIQRGDSIVALDGQPVFSFSALSGRISTAAGRPVRVDLVRAGQPVSVTVVPQATSVTDPTTGESKRQGKIGIAPRQGTVVHEDVSLAEAIPSGLRLTGTMAGAVVGTLKSLANRTASVKELGGPIAIARTSVQAARQGVQSLLYLIALLSINVAVLNLLPIPILDGGQVLLNVAEAVKGRQFSMRTREYILRVGLVAIGLLFVTVMWNDITRLITDVVR